MAKSLSEYRRRAYQDFRGGLNNLVTPLVVQPNEFSELKNAYVNVRGVLEKSKGYTKDAVAFPNVAANFIRMMGNYKRGTTVDKLVIAASDSANTNATYKVDLKATSGDSVYDYIGYTTGTATFTNGSANVSGSGTLFSTHLKAGDKIKPDTTSTWYEIQSCTNATALVLTTNFAEATQTGKTFKARIILHKDFIPQGVTFNNNFIVSNGSEVPMSFNNTTLTLITDADTPKVKFLEVHKSRVFGASTSGNPSRLYWSAVNDETSWDATSEEDIFPQDGSNICAIRSFANSMIVFKDSGTKGAIYQVVGAFDQDAVGSPADIRKVDAPDNIGGILGYSPAVCDDGNLYFLTETGLYSLDTRMYVQKISWRIEGTTTNLTTRSTLSSAKTYTYDTAAQWNAGTSAGNRVTSTGEVTLYSDKYTFSDAFDHAGSKPTPDGSCNVLIDTNNAVHAIYCSNDGFGLSIVHKKIDTDGNITTYDTRVGLIDSIPAVPNVWSWSVGIAPNNNISLVTGRTTSSIRIYEFNGTTWSAETIIDSSATGFIEVSSIQYTAANLPRVVYGGASGIKFASYSGSVWTTSTIASITGTAVSTASPKYRISMCLDGSNLGVSFTNDNTTIRAYKSTNDGSSWTNTENFSATLATTTPIRAAFDASDNLFTGYTESSAIKARNHSGAATTTIDSASLSQMAGYNYYSGGHYAYNMVGTSPTQTEKFTFNTSSTASNTTQNVVKKTFRPGEKALEHNGNVFASICFGANANEVVIRRITFTGVYTSDERSDSTLTVWGTYDVSGESLNGGTITYQVALASSSPATSFTTILAGAVISTDPTLVFIKTKITLTVASSSANFAIPEVGSVILNFTGSGIDAKLPSGIVFNTEYYVTVTEAGQANNSLITQLDRGKAFTTFTPQVFNFCRYKNKLYAGSATNGDVLILNNGYNYAGSTYAMTATLKEDILGSLELEKTIHKAYVIYEVQSAGTFSFDYRLDNFLTPGGATWSTNSVDQTTTGIAEIDIFNKARSIQFRVTGSDLDAPISIIGFVVLYTYLNPR